MPGLTYKKIFSIINEGSGIHVQTKTQHDKDLTDHFENLKKVNEELRLARRAALNLMEDAILSKEALAKSEEKYRTLFENMDEGFCIIQMMYDQTGRVVNYRFIEVNRSFERQTGLKNVIGKTGRELIQRNDLHWIETYDKIAQTGESIRFENYDEATERWYESYASRVGNPGDRQIAIVFNDITRRKRYEQHQSLLAEISKQLLTLDSIDQTMQLLAAKIGTFFKVTWCTFAGLSDGVETSVVANSWTAEGAISLNGN